MCGDGKPCASVCTTIRPISGATSDGFTMTTFPEAKAGKTNNRISSAGKNPKDSKSQQHPRVAAQQCCYYVEWVARFGTKCQNIHLD